VFRTILMDSKHGNIPARGAMKAEERPVVVQAAHTTIAHAAGKKVLARAASMVETRTTTPESHAAMVSQLQRCLFVLVTVYKLFGFDANGYKTGNTLRHWMNLCVEVGGPNAWLKVAKYKLAAFFAAHKDQPLPPKPFKQTDSPSALLGGRAFRWQARALRSESSDSFLTTILYSKKGFPRPDKAMVTAAELEAVRKLTTKRPTAAFVRLHAWADEPSLKKQQDLVLFKSTVQLQLRRTVRELYEGKKYGLDDRILPFFPSTSANYNRSRSAMGAVGEVLAHPDLLAGLREPIDGVQLQHDSTIQRGDEHRAKDPWGWHADTRVLDDKFRRFYWRLLTRAEGEVPVAEPVGLPEALKIRVITKGPPLTYTALKPLQRFLWKVLKCHPAFVLVGTPVTAAILQKQLGRGLAEGEMFLSGDYQDATNELHGWVSETIADELAVVLQLSAVERRLFVRALTQHVFEGADGNWLPQETGQLMGSVVSFPVLCIANAALTRYAMEQAAAKKMPLHCLKALFNGDDVVAKTTAEGCRLWRIVTAFAGLKERVGKSYYSRDFLNVNSTNFRYTPEVQQTVVQSKGRYTQARLDDMRSTLAVQKFLPVRLAGLVAQYTGGLEENSDIDLGPFPVRAAAFVSVDYVNMGLLFGLKRSGLQVGAKDVVGDSSFDETVGSRARELSRSAPPSLRDAVMTEFLRRNGSMLKGVRVPWFVPEYLGGVGLPAFFDSRDGTYHGPTMVDLQKGADIFWNKRDEVRRGTDSGWKVHALVQQRLPVRQETLSADDEESWGRVYGRLCVSLLFDSRIDPSQLFDESAQSLKNLRANERLWAAARYIKRRTAAVAQAFFTPPDRQAKGLPVASFTSLSL